MSAFKKAIGAGTVGVLTEFATKWLNLLHIPAFTHPDWEASVNGEALFWSVCAIIIIYVIATMARVSKTIIGGVTIVFLIVCGLMLLLCSHYSGVVPEQRTTAAADQLIARWHDVFVAADVLFVSAGTCFGLWLSTD